MVSPNHSVSNQWNVAAVYCLKTPVLAWCEAPVPLLGFHSGGSVVPKPCTQVQTYEVPTAASRPHGVVLSPQVRRASATSTWSWGTWPCAAGQETCTSSASQRRPCPASSRWATTRTSPACTPRCAPPAAAPTSSRTNSGRWVMSESGAATRAELHFVEIRVAPISRRSQWQHFHVDTSCYWFCCKV